MLTFVFVFCFFLSFTGNTVCKWQSNLCMMRKDFFIMDFQICCSNYAPAAPSLTPAEPKSSSIDVMAKTACVTCNWWKKCSRRTCRNSRREPQAGQQGSSSSLSQGFGAVAPFHSYVTFDPVSWSALLVLVNWGQLKVFTPFLKIWSKWDDYFFSSNVCDEICFVFWFCGLSSSFMTVVESVRWVWVKSKW